MRLLGFAVLVAASSVRAQPAVTATACQELVVQHRWVDVLECGAALAKVEPAAGAKFKRLAAAEAKAEVATRTIADAILRNDLRAARKALATIPVSSVYHAGAKLSVEGVLPTGYTCAPGSADRLGGSCTCPITHSPARDTTNTAICKIDPCRNGTAVIATEQKGDTAMQSGSFMLAVSEYEKILECGSAPVLRKAFLAACRAKHHTKAKQYFKRLPRQDQDKYVHACFPQFDPSAS